MDIFFGTAEWPQDLLDCLDHCRCECHDCCCNYYGICEQSRWSYGGGHCHVVVLVSAVRDRGKVRPHDRNISVWAISAWLMLLAITDVLDLFGWLPNLINLNVFSSANLLLFAYTMIAGIISLAMLIELCFRRGINGPNRYGTDPLAKA
jgi:hypothetical protein